jgi:hypothetical protein
MVNLEWFSALATCLELIPLPSKTISIDRALHDVDNDVTFMMTLFSDDDISVITLFLFIKYFYLFNKVLNTLFFKNMYNIQRRILHHKK